MVKINGTPTEIPAGAIAYKYADPTEDARWITDRQEAEGIAADDPSLIVWAPADFRPTHRLDGEPVQVIDEGTDDGSSGVYTAEGFARDDWPFVRVTRSGEWVEAGPDGVALAVAVAPGRIEEIR